MAVSGKGLERSRPAKCLRQRILWGNYEANFTPKSLHVETARAVIERCVAKIRHALRKIKRTISLYCPYTIYRLSRIS